jgi:hypothetical protein
MADPFALDAQLSDEERMVRDTAEAFAQCRPKVEFARQSLTGSV